MYLNVELLLCYASQNMGIIAKCCNGTLNDTCCILIDMKSEWFLHINACCVAHKSDDWLLH